MRPAASAPAGAPLILAAALCYGLNAAPAREAAGFGVGGADVVALRHLLLFALVGALAVSAGRSLALPRGGRGALIGLGVTSAMVGAGYITAVGWIPVGVAVMIFYTNPLIVLLVSPFVDGRRPTPAGLAGFALAFAGLAIAIGPALDGLDPRGLAFAAMGALGGAAQGFFAARAAGGGGLVTVFWAQIVMIPLVIAVSLALGGPAPAAAWSAAATPVAVTIGLYMAAYVLHMRAMRAISPAAAGMIFCLEPVVATAGAALWLGERLTATQYAGAALVLAGVTLDVASRSRASRRAQAAPA